jgi:hypothetical protein
MPSYNTHHSLIVRNGILKKSTEDIVRNFTNLVSLFSTTVALFKHIKTGAGKSWVRFQVNAIFLFRRSAQGPI